MTFPRSVGQIPFAFPFKPGSDSKGFVRVSGALYPFGYGLSYTTFAYSGLEIKNPAIGVQGTVDLSCKVKNTGKVAGDEVVQLYLHDRDFLDGLVTKVYEFGNKRVREHLCGIYEFLDKKKMETLNELEIPANKIN